MTLWSIIGIIAAACVTIGWLPEIWQGLKTKSLDGVVWWLLLTEFLGSSLFISYGIHIRDPVVIGTNVVADLFLLTLIMMKWRFSAGNRHRT